MLQVEKPRNAQHLLRKAEQLVLHKKVLTLGVTTFRGIHDLNVDELLPRLTDFMEGRCEAAFFGTERGGNCSCRMRYAAQMCDLYNSYTTTAYRQPGKACPVYVFIYTCLFVWVVPANIVYFVFGVRFMTVNPPALF